MSTALYRKYRPDNFESIIGQSQVIDVLKRQIKENKVSHAYIFNGTRGTGKTSTAKVFARAVNCLNYDEEKGPCNECENCKNDYVDTVEIDAASNNSVDNIRQLRDSIIYQPTFGRYKIYIIDEVHMLSQGAFNALLKTLEEPPLHIIFILATTEIEKIPSTILSRCQKFEFKKVDVNDIKSRLIHILKNEGIDFDNEAVDYIANVSGGGLRDAISMIDQVSSYGSVNMKNIDFVTGQASVEKVDEFIERIFQKNSFSAISIVNDIIQSSIDIKKFPIQIISRLLEVLYFQNEVQKEDIINIEKIKDLSKNIKSQFITDFIVDISDIENEMKYSSTPDILFQAFVIRQCKEKITKDDSQIEFLLRKIEDLENKINEVQSAEKIYLSNEENDKTAYKEDKVKPSKKNETVKLKDDISEEEKMQIEHLKSMLNEIHTFFREKKNAHLSALLHEGNIRRCVGDDIYISYSKSHNFHKSKIQQGQNIIEISKVFSKILDKKVNVHIVFDDEIINVKNDEDENIIKAVQSLFGEDVKIEVIDD